MSILSDFISTVNWISDPMIGAELDDLFVSGPGETLPPVPSPAAAPPCGQRGHHHKQINGQWSAGTWLCAIATAEGKDPHAVTKELRDAPGFSSLRAQSEAEGFRLTSDPVYLPFLARKLDGKTVYRRIHSGENAIDVLARLT